MRFPKTLSASRFGKLFPVVLWAGWAIVSLTCETVVPQQSWSRKWGPMVPHTQFPGDCGICHIPERWDVLREDFHFDHEKETGYRLEGAHTTAACLRCHNDRGPVEVYLSRGCGGCHVDSHKGSLGSECTRCHNQSTWHPTGIIGEHARTRFSLVGLHALAPCESCHDRATSGDFRGAPVDCHGCHQLDAARAFPNHVINGWVVDCERCHTASNWDADEINHDFFPLVGGHAGLDCTQCHVNGLFAGLNPDCFACHQNDYIAAPNHVAQNFSTDCAQCHNIFAWR